jgi:hypothetical protein
MKNNHELQGNQAVSGQKHKIQNQKTENGVTRYLTTHSPLSCGKASPISFQIQSIHDGIGA